MKCTSKLLRLFAVILFCSISQFAFSQALKDFFSNSDAAVIYLGVDFTKAKLINYPNPNPSDIKERIYNSINEVVVNEPKKYDISGALRKNNVTSDLTAVREHNEKIKADEIVSNNTADFSRLKESDIASVVKGLNLSGKKGVGILFVMEGMKKDDKNGDASVWAVLVDLSSKKVLLCERFECKATGFGFRNYWASTIKVTLDAIEKKKYKEWRDKNGG